MWPKLSCKNCEKREVGCHSNCPDYKRFRDELEAEKKAKEDWLASRGFHGDWSQKPKANSRIKTRSLADGNDRSY